MLACHLRLAREGWVSPCRKYGILLSREMETGSWSSRPLPGRDQTTSSSPRASGPGGARSVFPRAGASSPRWRRRSRRTRTGGWRCTSASASRSGTPGRRRPAATTGCRGHPWASRKARDPSACRRWWLAGDPLGIRLLGKPDYVPKAENPTLASGGRELLRLFLSVPGSVGVYYFIQVSQAGGEWGDGFQPFRVP